MSATMGCLILTLPWIAHASNGFLQAIKQDTLTAEEQSAVLIAIEEVLGAKNRHAIEVRMGPLEALLEPTLASLPRNDHGKFGHKATRYALHRLFVQRHAWFVKGIGVDVMEGEENSTSMLPSSAPELVQTLIEKRFGSQGVDAHEIAVMAATLENLAHLEAMERARTAYAFLNFSTRSARLTMEWAVKVLDVYMASFVTRTNLTMLPRWGRDGYSKLMAFAEYRTSEESLESLRTFIRQVFNETTQVQESYSFLDLSHVITRIGDKYGRWQTYECDDLKHKLFGLEDDGTGRVSLAKFYKGNLNQGHWQFGESADYLRASGVLDESNPSNPRVIVSNYILSPANCLAASSYYSVCCLDKCEDLFDHLEREIRAPAATPEKITALVTAMPSASAFGNRSISDTLLERLHQIASRNGGMVPLHGRLFAQWLHHLYPRECPYPHMPGTTIAMRAKDFKNKTGKNSTASKEEMTQCIAVSAAGEAGGSDMPWSDEDTLFVEPSAVKRGISDSFAPMVGMIRFLVFIVPAFSMLLFIFRLGGAIEIKTDKDKAYVV